MYKETFGRQCKITPCSGTYIHGRWTIRQKIFNKCLPRKRIYMGIL